MIQLASRMRREKEEENAIIVNDVTMNVGITLSGKVAELHSKPSQRTAHKEALAS